MIFLDQSADNYIQVVIKDNLTKASGYNKDLVVETIR